MTLEESAVQVGEALNVPPNIILAQWNLESGWGKSPANSYNFGGIKNTDGSWKSFDSMEHWTEYMTWYLDQYEGLADSQDLDSYVYALKQGNYFGKESIESYKGKMQGGVG